MKAPLLLAAVLLVACQVTDREKRPAPSVTERADGSSAWEQRLRDWERGIPDDAKITLEEDRSGVCVATIDENEIEIKKDQPNVAWRVINKCKDVKRVSVGVLKVKGSTDAEDTKHFLPLVCQFREVEPTDNRVIWCAISKKCRDVDYEYKVCMGGKIAIDPELRIKGDKSPGDDKFPRGCPTTDKSFAKWHCEQNSSIDF